MIKPANKNSSIKSESFEKVVIFLNEKKVPFCVLRNYEQYPERIDGDIDILVLPEFMNAIRGIMKAVAAGVGGQILDFCGRENLTGALITIFRFEGEEIQAVNFDFSYKLEKFGVEYIDKFFAIENKRPFKNFFILDEKTEFFHVFIHGMFNFGPNYKKRYGKKIMEYLDDGRKIPKEQIFQMFPGFIAKSILNSIKNRNIDRVFNNSAINKISFIIKNRVLLRRFLFCINEGVFKRIKRLLCPSGELVVFLGPDGVGKSTTAEIASRLLKALNIPSHHVHLGFRPTVLPRRQKIGFGEPQKQKKYPARDFFRYCYHFLDYWLEYWLHIRPRLLRGEIVIAERYFYDYIIHPDRKEVGVNRHFVWWTFRFFMPKPTACVLFVNDSGEILKRRQELTKEEIKDVISKGRELGKTVKKFIEIKTDKSPEEVAKKTVEWIVCKN